MNTDDENLNASNQNNDKQHMLSDGMFQKIILLQKDICDKAKTKPLFCKLFDLLITEERLREVKEQLINQYK